MTPAVPPQAPAPYFDDPEQAYDALLEWRRESERLADLRDPLVLGALRVFPDHGDVSKVNNATGLSRSTVRRIIESGGTRRYVDEARFPDVALYGQMLGLESTKITPPASGADEETFLAYQVTRTALHSLSARIREVVADELELLKLSLDLRREASDLRNGVTETYEAAYEQTPSSLRVNAAMAELLERAALQIDQFRLRGEQAFDDLDPALVAEAEAARAADHLQTMIEFTGNERYANAMREGRSVHGTRERDDAASCVLIAARSVAKLQAEIAKIRDGLLLEPEDAEVDKEPRVQALQAVAAADPDVREALEQVVGASGLQALIDGKLEDSQWPA
ncbi:hypothetical protein [Streptomyces sp. NPDC085665]|uniref:hypothetical protein n=1 Tax=Streptomyces sp. NPDC085665 TaxID=3365735 RepID=UPI0037D188CF